MDPKEIEQKLKSFQDVVSSLETKLASSTKEFELKLESQKKDADQWKDLAFKREEENRQYKEKLEADKAAREKSLAEGRKNEILEFAEGLIKKGVVLPAQKEQLIKLMESLTSEGEIFRFAEKDGSTKIHSQLSLFKLFMGSITKKQVDFSETTIIPGAITSSTPEGEEESVQFTEVISKGTKKLLPLAGVELDKAAKEYMAKMGQSGVVVSYTDAIFAVMPKKKAGAAA